jgi:predicted DNA-binding transcriptional regulator AlpA
MARPEVPGKKYITATQLRERWGNVSHMFICRLLQSDPNFPRPMKLSGRLRFFDVAAIEDYERSKIKQSA